MRFQSRSVLKGSGFIAVVRNSVLCMHVLGRCHFVPLARPLVHGHRVWKQRKAVPVAFLQHAATACERLAWAAQGGGLGYVVFCRMPRVSAFVWLVACASPVQHVLYAVCIRYQGTACL